MTDNSVIDTALTLFLVYLYISLTCSALNEWLASMLQRRPKMLRDAIRGLLGEKMQEALYKTPHISALKTKRYEDAGFPDNFFNGVIRLLNTPMERPIGRPKPLPVDRDPAVIPPEAFVAGLLSVLHTVEVKSVPDPLTVKTLRQAIVEKTDIPAGAALPAEKLFHAEAAKALLGLLEDIGTVAPSPTPQPIAPPDATTLALVGATLGLSGAAAGTPAVSMLPASGMDEAKKRLSTWYSDALNRTTGAYKRKTQVYLIFWAIGVCALVNADTIKISRLRYQSNTAAQYAKVAASLLTATKTAQTAEHGGQPGAAPTGTASGNDALSQQTLDAQLKLLRAEHLPLGWTENSFNYVTFDKIVVKLLGLMITAVAAAQGAPFWFDVINRFVNLRLTGPLPTSPAAKKTP